MAACFRPVRLGVCTRGCVFLQVPYVASPPRDALVHSRESKHADNSAALTTLAIDLQDRHCFVRTLCNSSSIGSSPTLPLFFFSSSRLSFSFSLSCFSSFSCNISFGSLHGYHEFLRKLHRNRATWLSRPTQFTFEEPIVERGNSNARNTRCRRGSFKLGSLFL